MGSWVRGFVGSWARGFLAGVVAVVHLAAAAQSLTLGAVLQQGYVFPFAVYESGTWRAAPLDGAQGSWAFHPVGRRDTRELRTGVAVPPGFCGALVPAIPPIVDRAPLPAGAPSTDVHASYGLARRGDARVTALERLETTSRTDASARRVQALLDRERHEAFQRAYGAPAPPQEPAGARLSETWWRTTSRVNGRHLYRIEYDRLGPAGTVASGTFDLELWVVDDPARPESVVLARFFDTGSDEIKTSTTVTPYGVLAIDGRVFVVSDEHGWEHVDYVIREWDTQAFIERLRVLGPCAG